MENDQLDLKKQELENQLLQLEINNYGKTDKVKIYKCYCYHSNPNNLHSYPNSKERTKRY